MYYSGICFSPGDEDKKMTKCKLSTHEGILAQCVDSFESHETSNKTRSSRVAVAGLRQSRVTECISASSSLPLLSSSY